MGSTTGTTQVETSSSQTFEVDKLPVMNSASMFRPLSTSFVTDENPGLAPPCSNIIDLDAVLSDKMADQVQDPYDTEYLRQVAHFAQVTERWVVFSDLHVTPSTLDTCLQVLRRVHDTAVAKDAGIVFLGDFWHLRGTLRVDCLNAVLVN